MNIESYQENPQIPPPIKERIGKGMFTDRESEMAHLMDWADSVSREAQKSIALVSPRRYGKTAIMERFYNRIFWERNDLAPFYFELKPDKLYVRNFINEYCISFLRQFLACRTKNAALAFDSEIGPEELYKLAEEAKVDRVMQSIDRLPYWQKQGLSNFFHMAIEMPRTFAAREKENFIVMFDEFQRLNQVLYFDEELQRQCPPYTGAYSSVVEAAIAPMFIAGSQMTILAREALSGGMTGRVRQIKLKRMNKDGCAKLATKLAYEKGFDLSLDLAHTIADLTWRHPYYIWCLFNTNRLDDGLHTEEDVKARLKFEIEDNEGLINEFWREHFVENMETLNEPDTKKMIFYLMQQPEREARVDEIVDELGLKTTKEEANRQLVKLMRGDLIKRISMEGVYSSVQDPMLDRVLRLEYSWELQDLKRAEVASQIELELAREQINSQAELINTLRGELNTWVGRLAEGFIEKLMKKFFTGQTVSGQDYFHYPHEVKLSRFKRVYTTMAQTYGGTQPYQIDIYGEPEEAEDLPWIVEVKNWRRPVDKARVEHFMRAAENFESEKGYNKTVRWFYARSGFTQPAQELLEKQGILYMDQEQLIQMLHDFDVVEQWYDE